MAECIAEDELLDLAQARTPLADAPALEAHLADCPACSTLLATLVAAARDGGGRGELLGRRLGPYRLDGLIGAGAMGEVYRGWDQRLHRSVAVKVLSRDAAGPERVRRLTTEARAAAAIAHVNVVTVHDVGTDGDLPYVVSELISGESLRSVIERGPIARAHAVGLLRQLARGVAAAHAQGVVHRDLKPENLIVADDGTLKILDFGLARAGLAAGADGTRPGTVIGTSGYLAPEQARGEPADARSDVFAVGAIGHELLTGQRAFAGATFAERLSAVLRDTPPPIDDPVGPAIARCLAKDPARRFQSAADLAWVLDDAVAAAPPADDDAPGLAAPAVRPPRASSRRTFVAGAAATGVVGLALGRWLGPGRPAARRPVPQYQQLTFRHGRVTGARFTRDGGSVLYAAAWDDAPTAIFTARLGGGGTRALALPPAQLLAVSARGELAIALDHRFIEGFHQRGQLALAPLEGGAPRALGVDVQDADFTPDGAELAIVRAAGGRFRLELPIGTPRLEAGWIARPRIAPDGRTIACLVHDGPDDDRGDVVVVGRAGGAPRTVAPGWSSVDGLAWCPDGRGLWISASVDGGNNALWQLGLDGRRRDHVASAGRVRLHDARAGRLAITHTAGRVRLMVKAPGDAAEVDRALSDIAIPGGLSGDGRTLVFGAFGDVDTAYGAYLLPTAGGAALRLGDGVPLDLADDGRGVLALSNRPPPVLVAFPVPGGQPRPLAAPGLAVALWARWCTGGVAIGGAARGRPPRLWHLDDDGALTARTAEGELGEGAVSPDGGRVAMIAGERLRIVDLLAGAAGSTVVPGEFRDQLVCGWDADGTGVLVRTRAIPVTVARVDLATGAATPRFTIDPPPLGRRGVNAVVVDRAADAYAYSYGQELSRLYTMTV